MSIINLYAVAPASDFETSLVWYQTLFGAQGRRPMEGEDVIEWQLTGSSGLQLISESSGAGGASVTIGVDDIDSHVSMLNSRGLATSEPSTQQGIRIAVISDPDGNVITFAQPIGAPA